MSNIKNAFSNGKALITFLTGGDPTIEASEEYIREMIRAGADLIEIGIPFSDPIAEGETIQRANLRALSSGTTVNKLFDLVARVRTYSDIPLVFLTYLNPVFHYGYENFFAQCKASGLDGVIIPDLPFEEQAEPKAFARKYEVDIITLAAPTSERRVRELAASADGFLYIVSSMGVTGVRSSIHTDLAHIVSEAKAVSNVPCAVGFGIGTPAQAKEVAKTADGVIVGSAIVKMIEEHGTDAAQAVYEFVRSLREVCI